MEISYQLYSSRMFPPLDETLTLLAETGYRAVEGYGAFFADDADLGALKAQLDASGLTMPTAHIGWDLLRDRPSRVIEIARALGLQAVFGPFLGEGDRPATPEGWTAFGEMLGEAAKPLQDAGLVVGWHNHAFEFQQVAGELPMELILAADADLTVEFDIAWAVKAGVDPMPWIAANEDRIAAVHVKDIAPEGTCEDEDGWADPGHGTLDWPPILNALRDSACNWVIAEHDNPSDHRRFAKRAFGTLKGLMS